jgi:hypothetical protein
LVGGLLEDMLAAFPEKKRYNKCISPYKQEEIKEDDRWILECNNFLDTHNGLTDLVRTETMQVAYSTKNRKLKMNTLLRIQIL